MERNSLTIQFPSKPSSSKVAQHKGVTDYTGKYAATKNYWSNVSTPSKDAAQIRGPTPTPSSFRLRKVTSTDSPSLLEAGKKTTANKIKQKNPEMK